jgi:hypothetical protein
VTKHQQNDRKFRKNSRTHQLRPLPSNPWAHRWDQLWSLPGDLKRNSEHAPHCSVIMTMHMPTRPWKPQSLWLATWLLLPIPPISWT